jgi:hypothetical protein
LYHSYQRLWLYFSERSQKTQDILYYLIYDEHIIVRLVHARNRALIMSDLASSIRECLISAIHKISRLYINTSSDRTEVVGSFRLRLKISCII